MKSPSRLTAESRKGEPAGPHGGAVRRPAAARRPAAPDPAALGRAARMLRALAQEERLRLAGLLLGPARTVGDLAAATQSALPTVSQRLRALHAAGLLERRRQARYVLYSLADAHVAEIVRSLLDHAAEDRGRPDAPGKGTRR